MILNRRVVVAASALSIFFIILTDESLAQIPNKSFDRLLSGGSVAPVRIRVVNYERNFTPSVASVTNDSRSSFNVDGRAANFSSALHSSSSKSSIIVSPYLFSPLLSSTTYLQNTKKQLRDAPIVQRSVFSPRFIESGTSMAVLRPQKQSKLQHAPTMASVSESGDDNDGAMATQLNDEYHRARLSDREANLADGGASSGAFAEGGNIHTDVMMTSDVVAEKTRFSKYGNAGQPTSVPSFSAVKMLRKRMPQSVEPATASTLPTKMGDIVDENGAKMVPLSEFEIKTDADLQKTLQRTTMHTIKYPKLETTTPLAVVMHGAAAPHIIAAPPLVFGGGFTSNGTASGIPVLGVAGFSPVGSPIPGAAFPQQAPPSPQFPTVSSSSSGAVVEPTDGGGPSSGPPTTHNATSEQFEQLGCGFDFLTQSCKDVFQLGWCQHCTDFGNVFLHDCKCTAVTSLYANTVAAIASAAAANAAALNAANNQSVFAAAASGSSGFSGTPLQPLSPAVAQQPPQAHRLPLSADAASTLGSDTDAARLLAYQQQQQIQQQIQQPIIVVPVASTPGFSSGNGAESAAASFPQQSLPQNIPPPPVLPAGGGLLALPFQQQQQQLGGVVQQQQQPLSTPVVDGTTPGGAGNGGAAAPFFFGPSPPPPQQPPNPFLFQLPQPPQ